MSVLDKDQLRISFNSFLFLFRPAVFRLCGGGEAQNFMSNFVLGGSKFLLTKMFFFGTLAPENHKNRFFRQNGMVPFKNFSIKNHEKGSF